MHKFAALLGLFLASASLNAADAYDLIIRNGSIYDGSGGQPYIGDVAITGDKIAAVGSLIDATAKRELDAKGLAVAPGFINMLSWATESLITDRKLLLDPPRLRENCLCVGFIRGEFAPS